MTFLQKGRFPIDSDSRVRKSLLLVEDDLNLSQILCREFQDRDLDVTTLANHGEIKSWMDSFAKGITPIEYALIDMRIGHSSSLPLVEFIHANQPSCRIVIMTGYGSIVNAVEAMKRGASEYLTKPISMKDLDQALWGGKEQELRSDLNGTILSPKSDENCLADQGGDLSRAKYGDQSGDRNTENLFRPLTLSQMESEYIQYLLTQNKGNISKTARDLGVHRQSLQRKLKKYTS